MTVGGVRSLFGAAIAAALLAAVSACGGGGSSSSATNASFATGSSSAAGIAPASSLAYFAVDTTLDSTQWKRVGTLLSRFPDRTKLLTQLLQSWKSGTKTSFDTDVKPALGDQLDGVVFSKARGGGPDFVALLQPKNESAFKQLIAKLNASDPSNAASVGDFRGWKVVGQSLGSISAFEAAAKAGPALADDATFTEAIGNLSGEAVATAYANGAKLTSALTSALPQAATAAQGGKLTWAAADLSATPDGLRLDLAAKSTSTKSPLQPQKATLLQKIPADALGVLSFNGDAFRRSRTSNLSGSLQQGLKAAGTPVPGLKHLIQTYAKLAGAFGHENALYVRRSPGPFPEVTLVTTPSDPASVDAAVSKAVRSLGGAQTPARPVTIGTVAAHVLDLGRISLFWGVQDGDFIVTNSRQAFGDLHGGGAKLADDSTYNEAKSQSGAPDATDGFLYVNLTTTVQTIESFAQAAGSKLPPEVENNLQPLHTAMIWATNNGTVEKSTVFVGIN
jgi:hypothetical protein